MSAHDRIAVVGMAGLFAGAPDLESFWKLVESGRDATSEPPPGRWLLGSEQAYDPGPGVADRVYATRGGFIDAPAVETRGLDIDGDLLARLDPLFRTALETARRAWCEARTEGLDRGRVGVILGNIVLPTEAASALARETLGRAFAEQLGVPDEPGSATEPLNAFPAALPAGLIARALGFGGTAYTLDAACASSLYALKLAADELLAGRAEAMLSGGLSRPDPLYTQMGFSQLRALGAGGRPRPFDARGDGLIVGEGAGVFVLKRLTDALRDGDTIHGVIAGAGLSNDIDGGLLAPSSEGQLRAMRAAYERAGWSPHDVDLVECHATGTPVGDAVEAASLRALWGAEGWSAGQCALGSVKSNIGHALTAAGAAGLLKVLLALRHRTLPPTANYEAPNPALGLEGSPFQVLSRARPWSVAAGRPRRAAISGFGFGGINAHVLVEEWAPDGRAAEPKREPPEPAPVAIVGLAAHVGPFAGLRAFQERALGAGAPAEPTEAIRTWGIASSPGYYLNELSLPLERFRIPPRELEEMLPQQSLMLRVAAEAIADAGWDDRPRSRAGTFIGIGLDLNTTNFHLRWWVRARAPEWARRLGLRLAGADLEGWAGDLADAVGPPLNANRTMGALGGLIASRIAREFRIGGPSFTVSSDETSGTRALAVAVNLLRQHELDEAVVGAVDLPGDPRAALSWQALGVFGPRGEGAVALVLKRLEDAERDGDHVYAVLDGEDGRVSAAYLDGPAHNHATDSTALACARNDFGHLGAASSLIAVAKAVLCLEQQILPAWRGDRPTAPRGFVPRAAQFWLRDRDDGPRTALVAARGLGGSVDRVGLAEHASPARDPLQPLGTRPVAVFAIEADDRGTLTDRLDALDALAQEEPSAAAERAARRWWARHQNEPARRLAVGIAADSVASLRAQLAAARSAIAEGRALSAARGPYLSPPLVPDGPAREPLGRGGIALVFPGLGNLFAGMGRTLSAHWPDVLRGHDAESGKLRSQLAPGAFWNDDPPAAFRDHRAPILGQVALGALVGDLLRSFGIVPSAAIGYSLGETASLVALRAWTERDEMLRRLDASPLFRTALCGPCDAARRTWGVPDGQRVDWLAGVVSCPPAAVAREIEGRKRVYRLIVNSSEECVIGGERAAVLRLVEDLGCRLIPLPLVSTVHCAITRVVAREYRELHELATTPPPGVRFYSGAWGHAFRPGRTTAANAILAHAIEGIDFPRVVERAYVDGVRVFLEAGPGASCSRLITAILGDRPHLARSACVAGQDEVATVLDLLARLVAERVPLDFTSLYGRESAAVGHRAPGPPAGGRMLTVHVGGRPFSVPVLPRPEPPPTDDEPPPPIPPRPVPARSYAVPVPVPALDPSGLQPGILAGATARAGAHEAYLGVSDRLAQSMANQLRFQMALVEALMTPGQATAWAPRMPRFGDAAPLFDRDQCLEIAVGSIGAVLGPEFAPVDAFPTRVRLPDEPLMLVDRIMAIEGEPRSMTRGRVVTEHDVLAGAWYLDGGRIPPCIAIESGQADLFLSGYLGIDFVTRGLAVYRLLDAAVTFHRGLPGPGAVIRYDIHIDGFFRQGDTHLFRFRFEAEVDGEPLLSMRDGCAGFFSAAELAAGKGIVAASLERRPQRGTLPEGWTPLVPMTAEALDDAQVESLRLGDLAGAFGPAFDDLPLRAPAPLPGDRMTLVDRVIALDPSGGRYGLGLIRAEADIHPGDWFMVCHFVDDRVMPGTLMYECCLHTLRIYLTRMGWIGEAGEVTWGPVPGVAARLRCRGQVTEATRKVVYEVSIKELGYGPEPFAIVDALMFADGKPIVEIASMSLRLTGQTRDGLERIWHSQRLGRSQDMGTGSESSFPGAAGAAAGSALQPLYNREHILAFATGKPSDAFGERFRAFDDGRFIARLPAPPYSFLDRITALNAEPCRMVAGGTAEAEYDVAPDEWYFAADRQPRMPFAVLLEVALQPCGWMAAFMGSALASDEPLRFRNLGGEAVLLAPVTPESGTLTTAVKVTGVAHSAGMIIQHFEFEVRSARGPVYRGKTYFGFFHPEALANQVGIREAAPYQPTADERARACTLPLPQAAPFPEDRWRMVERIDVFVPDGGPHGLGVVEGSKAVNPGDWFFKAHFYQDPVWPGSLGLESLIQLLKVVAEARWGVGPDTVFESTVPDAPHRWVYRGQIVPTCERATVQTIVTAVDDRRRALTADGFLSVDGRVIYQMNGFTLGIA